MAFLAAPYLGLAVSLLCVPSPWFSPKPRRSTLSRAIPQGRQSTLRNLPWLLAWRHQIGFFLVSVIARRYQAATMSSRGHLGLPAGWLSVSLRDPTPSMLPHELAESVGHPPGSQQFRSAALESVWTDSGAASCSPPSSPYSSTVPVSLLV